MGNIMNKVIELSKNEIVAISGGVNFETLKTIGKDTAIATGIGAGVGFGLGYVFLGGLMSALDQQHTPKNELGLFGGAIGAVVGAALVGGVVGGVEIIHMAKKWLSEKLNNHLEPKNN
jgi:hypothetical protein